MHRGLSIPAREGTPLPSFHVPQTLPQSTLGITPVPHVPGRWQQGSRAGAWALTAQQNQHYSCPCSLGTAGTPLQPCAADTKRREAQKFLILSLMGSTIILHCPGFFENCNLYYAAGFVNSLGSPTWLIFPCESVDDLTPCWAVVWGFPCVPSTP